VKLGRLEDGEKAIKASAEKAEPKDEAKPVVKQTLGLDLANLTDELRKRYKLKDTVKGVVITAVDPNSTAAEKRLTAGDVIVEVAQEPVANAEDIQKRVEQMKKDGRKSALFLVANSEGELRFVALSLQ
jgi:serine protease Do